MNLYVIPVSYNDYSPVLRSLVRTYKDINFLVYNISKSGEYKILVCYISNNQACGNVVWDKKYKNKKPYKQLQLNTQNLGELKKAVNNKKIVPGSGFVYSDTREYIRETNFIGSIVESDFATTMYINSQIRIMMMDAEIIRDQIRSAYELIQNTENI